MLKIIISNTYTLKWKIKGYDNYKVSTCGKIFNCQRRKQIKRVLNGGSVGFWIKGKFFTLKQLREKLELIKHSDCPF